MQRQIMSAIGTKRSCGHKIVEAAERCPNWQEMEFVKRMFFKDDDTAMQLHVSPSEHVNKCDTCLHLWRPAFCDISKRGR